MNNKDYTFTQLATLGRISGVGTELGAVAVAKRMGDSKHADGDHPFTIYAGLERTVEENVRLLKENEQLREQLSARQQAHDTATVETRNHNAELETTVRDLRQAKDKATRDLHATKEELSALHRDQDSAFDTIMSRLGVIVGQNECLKQKCEEVLKQNTVLQRQVQVLQKHHENLHRQYDKLCAGHEGVARDTAGLREQAEKIYKRQMHQETHALEPLLGRADAASDRLAVVVEQVMMVKEELECARREDADNEARGRWQDLAELGEETQRVARYVVWRECRAHIFTLISSTKPRAHFKSNHVRSSRTTQDHKKPPRTGPCSSTRPH